MWLLHNLIVDAGNACLWYHPGIRARINNNDGFQVSVEGNEGIGSNEGIEGFITKSLQASQNNHLQNKVV